MVHSLVDSERSDSVKKRVYLPDVDEFRSSSGPLSEVVLEVLGDVSHHRTKPLKEGYVADLTREAGVSPCSMILGLLYISRLAESNPRYLKSVISKDLFLTAMMIASKYLNDEGESEALTNSEWADIGCKSKPALDLMERQFLAAIDWRLYVSLEEYYSFVTGIEGRIALNQFAGRGWLTYTDLVTVWDAMDTQRALLTATKHVAKVTCGSAAVYLVLLSTLLTASHALHSTWSPSSPCSTSSPLPLSTTTNTSTSSQLQDGVIALMKEHESHVGLSSAQKSHKRAHLQYLYHDKHFLEHPPDSKPHIEYFLEFGIDAPLGMHDNETVYTENSKKTASGTRNLKQPNHSSRQGLPPLKYCNVMDSRLDSIVGFGKTVEFRFLWLTSIDLRGKWSMLGSGTRSFENFEHYWKQFHTLDDDDDNDDDGEQTEWIGLFYLYSCVETLGMWILDGFSAVINFAEALNHLIPSTNSSSIHSPSRVHTSGDPFPMLHLAGEGERSRDHVPLFLRGVHQKFQPYHRNKPHGVLSCVY